MHDTELRLAAMDLAVRVSANGTHPTDVTRMAEAIYTFLTTKPAQKDTKE